MILKDLLSDDLNATQLAEDMDIGVSAIRNHLETLEQRGYVEHFFERVSKGRPKKMYQLTEKGSKLFPKLHDKFSVTLIEVVRKEMGEEKADELLSKVARELGQEIKEGVDSSPSDYIDGIVGKLRDWGFFPESEASNGGYRLEQKNCVFPEVAKVIDRCFCEEMLSEAVRDDMIVENQKCFCAKENETCVHLINVED